MILSNIPLSGGQEESFFSSASKTINPQWGYKGKFITFMRGDSSVFKYDTVKKSFKLMAKKIPNKRWTELSPTGKFLAIGDLSNSGNMVTIRIFDMMKADKPVLIYPLPVAFKNFRFKFTPDNDSLLIVGRKTVTAGGITTTGTAVYLISYLSLGGDSRKIIEGPFNIISWAVTQDNDGFVFTQKDASKNVQIYYESFTGSWSPAALTSETGQRGALSFSKDGTRLAYQRRASASDHPLLYVLDYFSVPPIETQLTNGIDTYFEPHFTDDSNILTYITKDVFGYNQVHVLNLDLLSWLP